jgi:hypothetical protein
MIPSDDNRVYGDIHLRNLRKDNMTVVEHFTAMTVVEHFRGSVMNFPPRH